MIPVNYLAVVVSMVLMMGLGYVWYGPLFGKSWAALMGFAAEPSEGDKKSMRMNYVIMMIGSLLMAFVLAHAIIFANTYMQISGALAGILVGFMNWLGFIAPVTLGTVLWDKKPWKLWLINSGYYLVGLIIMGVILALWV